MMSESGESKPVADAQVPKSRPFHETIVDTLEHLGSLQLVPRDRSYVLRVLGFLLCQCRTVIPANHQAILAAWQKASSECVHHGWLTPGEEIEVTEYLRAEQVRVEQAAREPRPRLIQTPLGWVEEEEMIRASAHLY